MITLHLTLDFHPGYQPPEESGTYYCITTEGGTIQTLSYSAKWNRFNMADHDMVSKKVYAIKVRWWAPIPKAVQMPYGTGLQALGRR